MLYRLLINYLRLKIIGHIIRLFLARKSIQSKSHRTRSFLAYMLELGLTYLFAQKPLKNKSKIHKQSAKS